MNAASQVSAEERVALEATTEVSQPRAAAQPQLPPGTPADRFMRKLLRVTAIDKSARTERAAHRNFRTSMIISGVRCLVSYLIVPILIPIIGVAGIVAAPIGIALCIVAFVNGIYALRKFWSSNHRMRWMYTWFIAVVFAILIFALVSDVLRIVESL